MTRKIKALGLVLVTIAAMSMAAASAAQATELHATTPTTAAVFGTRTVTDTQNRFTSKAGTVVCTNILIEALATNTGQSQQQTTENELTSTLTLTGCSIAGLAANETMNGCKFTITGQNTDGQTIGSQKLNVDITGCTPGKQIEVEVPGTTCVLTAPEQHHLQSITFTNNAGAVPHDVTADGNITGFKYETHGLCPNNPTPTTLTEGAAHGQLTFQARVHSSFDQVTEHGHQYNKLRQQGALVGLQVT